VTKVLPGNDRIITTKVYAAIIYLGGSHMRSTDYDMIYLVEGHTYVLEPAFHIGRRGVYIEGCGLYNTSLEYLGWWRRAAMPPVVIKTMTAHVRELHKRNVPHGKHAQSTWKSLLKGESDPDNTR